MLKAKPIKPT